MSVSTAAPDVLEAAIADARRHARRRRIRTFTVSLAVFAATAAVGVPLAERRPAVRASPPPGAAPVAMRDGALTILAGAPKAPTGWYGISRIGVDGRLHPFVRCPNRARWCGEPESVAWTARGDRLALSVTSFGIPNAYNGIHVIDTRTLRDAQIRTPDDPPGEHDWFDLAWSPDGRTLAYVPAGASRTNSGTIVLLDADSGNRRVLPAPHGRKSSPAWSPDGTQIAFADEVDGRHLIYRIDLDGRNLRLLTDHGTAPAWSTTGVIAYHSDCGIRLMQPDGTAVVPPSARPCGAIGPPHLASPVWSPDGKHIAATLSMRRPDRSRGTYVMNSDGTGVDRVTPATLSVFVGGRPRVAWQPVP